MLAAALTDRPSKRRFIIWKYFWISLQPCPRVMCETKVVYAQIVIEAEPPSAKRHIAPLGLLGKCRTTSENFSRRLRSVVCGPVLRESSASAPRPSPSLVGRSVEVDAWRGGRYRNASIECGVLCIAAIWSGYKAIRKEYFGFRRITPESFARYRSAAAAEGWIGPVLRVDGTGLRVDRTGLRAPRHEGEVSWRRYARIYCAVVRSLILNTWFRPS